MPAYLDRKRDFLINDLTATAAGELQWGQPASQQAHETAGHNSEATTLEAYPSPPDYMPDSVDLPSTCSFVRPSVRLISINPVWLGLLCLTATRSSSASDPNLFICRMIALKQPHRSPTNGSAHNW